MLLVLLFNRTQAETCMKHHCCSSEKHVCCTFKKNFCRRSSSHNDKYITHNVPNQIQQHDKLISTVLTTNSLELHGKFHLPHRLVKLFSTTLFLYIKLSTEWIFYFGTKFVKKFSETNNQKQNYKCLLELNIKPVFPCNDKTIKLVHINLQNQKDNKQKLTGHNKTHMITEFGKK